jgi:hypothetical protein
MDHEQPLSPTIARIDLEIAYVKKELANTPKGPNLYTHAQLLFAKIGTLSMAKEIVLANEQQNNDPF